MNVTAGFLRIVKKNALLLVITLIVIIIFWGIGFLSLDQPDWGGGLDRLIYLRAVNSFFTQGNLYPDINRPLPPDLNFFNYSPLSILWLGVFSLLPPQLLYILHFAAVAVLFLQWKAIFNTNNIDIPLWIVPVWFAFSPFLYDAITLNVNTFLALLAAFYLSFMLKEDKSARLGAVFALFLMITIKPQWGFFSLLPLVQRRWKDFFQIIAGIGVLYLVIFGVTSILMSPAYIGEQHVLFVRHLATFTERFTYWNLAPNPYEYNNSIHQVAIYVVGDIKAGLAITKFIQFGLFTILMILFVRAIPAKAPEKEKEKGLILIRWFFILYCAALLFPPLNFDFSLAIPMFVFVAGQGRVQEIFLGIPLFFVIFQDLLRTILDSVGIPGWFPFIFTTTVLALIFLLQGKGVSHVQPEPVN